MLGDASTLSSFSRVIPISLPLTLAVLCMLSGAGIIYLYRHQDGEQE